MTKHILTTKEGAELQELYQEHAKASAHAGEVLRQYGMESPQFSEADANTGKIWRRIRELLGDDGRPWNA